MSNEEIKNQVLDFLQNLPESPFEQFNIAFDFYKKSERKNRAMEATYNRRGFSEQALKNLIYDLKKMYAITDVEVLTPREVEVKTDFLSLSDEEKIEFVKNLDLNKLDNYLFSQTPEVQENIKQIVKTEKDKQFLALITSKGTLEVNESEKEDVISLREEFPFLNDEKCPNILYIVVGKRIAAYNKYVALHEQLQKVANKEIELSAEEVEKLAFECNTAEEDNRALWNELNFYKENGKFLGEHPIFMEEVVKAEVDKMTMDKIISFKNSSSKYFHDKNNALEKFKDDPEKISKINTEIERRKLKLKFIDVKIGKGTDDSKK